MINHIVVQIWHCSFLLTIPSVLLLHYDIHGILEQAVVLCDTFGHKKVIQNLQTYSENRFTFETKIIKINTCRNFSL